jgi:hypothetical protein
MSARGWTRDEWLWARTAFNQWRDEKEEQAMLEQMTNDELCDAMAHLQQGRRSLLALELESTHDFLKVDEDLEHLTAEAARRRL